MRSGLGLATLLVSMLLPRPCAAQALTGNLTTTVRDAQGGVIVGAAVDVSSTSLIGGARRGTTDAKGQFRFPALPPGTYVLNVEMTKFASRRLTDVAIHIDKSIEIDVVLQARSQNAAVTVVGAGIDTRNPGLSTRYGASTIADIPTRRNNMFAWLMTAPGVSPTSQSTSFVSAFGSGVDQNHVPCRRHERHRDEQRHCAVGARHRLHPGDADSADRRVGRIRQRPGRGHQHPHAAGQQPVSVGRLDLRPALGR